MTDTPTPSPSALAPCPFCGEAGAVFDGPGITPSFYAGCYRDECHMDSVTTALFQTRDAAVVSWNRRATRAPVSGAEREAGLTCAATRTGPCSCPTYTSAGRLHNDGCTNGPPFVAAPPAGPTYPRGFMRPCAKPYGALPSMCRRLAGHVGECGPGDEVEQAMCRALEATEHLRRLEREGENIPGDLWNFVMRAADPPTPAASPAGPRRTTLVKRRCGDCDWESEWSTEADVRKARFEHMKGAHPILAWERIQAALEPADEAERKWQEEDAKHTDAIRAEATRAEHARIVGRLRDDEYDNAADMVSREGPGGGRKEGGNG